MLVLMSADFLATDYCDSEEMRSAIARHESGKLSIVPLILEPCDWKRSALGRLKPLPQGGLPVSAWKSTDAAFREIAAVLRGIVLDEGAVGQWDPTDTIVQTSGDACASSHAGTSNGNGMLAARRDAVFHAIREYFRRSTAEIRTVDGIAVRFRDLGPRRFACLAQHPLRNRSEATITIHAAEDVQSASGIVYSLVEGSERHAANGWVHVRSNGVGVYLDAHESLPSQPVSETTAAARLWRKFLRRAGLAPGHERSR
jgi:hypothetical protein